MNFKQAQSSIQPLTATSINGDTYVVAPLANMVKDLSALKKRRAAAQVTPQMLASRAPVPAAYSLAQWQTPIRDQKSRGTCWAFAGVAALEAAYRRKYGVVLDLSEHYLFHMSKCAEIYGDYMNSNVPHENNSSYWGNQGNSSIVEVMARIAIPEERFAPYLDQPQLDTIRTSLPAVGSLAWQSTQEQLDAFEYDERNIPTEARHQAKYKVKSWGTLTSPLSTDIMEMVLAANCEIVLDVDAWKWRYNRSADVYEFDPNATGGGGHVVLIVGYDRNRQIFQVKNSWNDGRIWNLTYDYIQRVSAQWSTGHYITDVEDINMAPQMKAKWLGRWNMDHDGWRGELVIRRFTSFHAAENAPTKLGNYYRDGKRYEVNGYFVDNGQGVVAYIADQQGKVIPGTLYVGQRHELYNYSWFPTLGAGKTYWNNIPFGSLVNRQPIPHKPSTTFDKDEWLGTWSMNHDGWRGTLTLNSITSSIWGSLLVKGTYLAQDGRSLDIRGWINPNQQHVLNLTIPFAADNNQSFELYYHTWENGIFSGVTTWAGRRYGVYGTAQLKIKITVPTTTVPIRLP